MTTAPRIEDADAVWVQWRAKSTPETTVRLMRALEPVISSSLTSWARGDQALRIRAYIIAREALNTYDPKQGTSVKTHVFNHLKRLNREYADRSRAVHVPEGVRMDGLKVRQYVEAHKDKYGREPSALAVADSLQMNIKRVQKAMQDISGEVPSSVAETEKGDILMPAKVLADNTAADFVYHDLDEVNRKVFEWTTGYGGMPVKKKQDIARDLGISPAAVSQRIGTIRKKLDALELNVA